MNIFMTNFTKQFKRKSYWSGIETDFLKNAMKTCNIYSPSQGCSTGLPGSGIGKGGGGGGAIRESGGAIGQYGTVQEESYFIKMQREQLKKLKKKLDSGESLEISQKEKDK